MTIKFCENGHFYDEDKTPTCPLCGGAAKEEAPKPSAPAAPPPKSEKSVKKKKSVSLFPKKTKEETPPAPPCPTQVQRVVPQPTEGVTVKLSKEELGLLLDEVEEDVTPPPPPLAPAPKGKKPVPAAPHMPVPPSVPAQKPAEEPAPPPQKPLAAAIQSAKEDGVTQGVYRDFGNESVVGWLVCIGGPHMGKDFRLIAGKNHIGRDARMEVALTDDIGVSRMQHATVIFDDTTNEFYLRDSENSKAVVRLNGSLLLAPTKLNARDVIAVGGTELTLLPFCNKTYNWERIQRKQQKPKGE
jgi:hypothetical protein